MKKTALYLSLLLIIFSKSLFSQDDNDTLYLKVMTYNIHHGEGIDGKIDINRIAKIIRETGVDLVALQEVDQATERSLGIKILDSLSSITKMHFYFDKNIDFEGGEYGNGILSRLPILVKYNYHYSMITNREQRGLLQTVVDFLGHEILFMATHLDSNGDDSERVASVDQIKSEIKKYPEMPVIICGDFNDTTMSQTILNMKEDYSDTWEQVGEGMGLTFPSDFPEKRIDYIFYSNKNETIKNTYLEPVQISVLRSGASDHLPVIAEFRLINKNTGNHKK